MFGNFFKIIYRDLVKDKTYTLIGILGLSAGIAVSILIISICFSYLSYDRFHKNGDRIYQAFMKNDFLKAGTEYSGKVPWTLGSLLKEEYPEVKCATTVLEDLPVIFIANNVKAEQKGCFADNNFFRVFTFPIIAGERNEVFTGNNSIAISESLAEKFFGSSADAVGKSIVLRRTDERRIVYVRSVFKDMPDNSSLRYDYVLPFKSVVDANKWLQTWPWGNYITSTYVELNRGSDIRSLNSKISAVISDRNPATKAKLFLYKFENLFINSPGGSDKSNSILVLLAVALIIIVIASINFINLATSRASKKSKEIGLRKVIGADRKSLIFRFLYETFILSFISVLLGLLIAGILLPYLNDSLNGILILSIPYGNLYFILSLVILWVVTAVLSGLYPAVYLSSLSPAGIFRSSGGAGGKIITRKILITLQFVFSTVFIFITAVVIKQMNFITGTDLGLNINRVIEFQVPKEIENHLNAFIQSLKLNPQIANVTYANFEPTGIYASTSDPRWEGKPNGLNDMFPVVSVGNNFLKTFDIHLDKGRDFLNGDSTDNNNFIINEKMAAIIGKDNPVGLGMSMWGFSGQIVGVVKDFHINALTEEMKPLIIRKNNGGNRFAFVKFNPGHLNEVLAFVEKTYDKYEKEYPFQYHFLDEQFLRNHTDAEIFGSLFDLFSVIAIVISCLGLFGLTAFTIQQKTKEIGVRKVLGASVKSITMLLTESVIKLVLIASVIALPVGYYFSVIFLRMFVYKTNIGVLIYLISVAIVLALASATVVFQAVKAAAANPIKSLRYE